MNAIATPVATHAKATAVFTCVLAALAGLMFGLDIGVISGATQFIQRDFAISDHMVECPPRWGASAH
jgi:SP family galactose:H+ symporter-like MFS transporter